MITFSDASGSWGCGAFSLPNWFHLQWSHNMQIFPIAVKELFPVVITAAIYGNHWSETCPIQGGQHCCSSGYSGHIQPRTPLNAPYSNTGVFAAHFNFWFSASHVAGTDNSLADSLSRNNTQLFLSQVPQAMRHPSRILLPLLKLLECNITWTTTAWTALFKSTLQQL